MRLYTRNAQRRGTVNCATAVAPAGRSSSDFRYPFLRHQFPLGASVCAIVIGIFVLTGWALNLAPLKSVVPGWGAMMPNAALGFILAGTALAILQSDRPERIARIIGLIGAVAVAALGLVNLCQYLFGWDAGIDQLLFTAAIAAERTAAPGRMSPIAAVNFCTLGMAMALLAHPDARHDYWSQLFALATLSLGATALIGYAYGVQSLYQIGEFNSMALHTAFTFTALASGVLAATARRGWMPVFISAGAGGVMLRQVLLPSIAALIVLGWLRLEGERANLYGTVFGLSLMVMMSSVVVGVLIWRSAWLLDAMDAERRRVEETVREGEARLRLATRASKIGSWDWNIAQHTVYISPEWKWQLGYDDAELPAMSGEWERRLHPQDRTRVRAALNAYIAGEQAEYDLEFRLRHKDGSYRWIYTRGELIRDDAGAPQRMLGCHIDVTERVAAERREAGERQVLEMAAKGSPLTVVLETLCRTVEEQSPRPACCSILLLDEDGVHLRHGAAPSLPASYCCAIDGESIGPAAGSCGTAIYLGQPVIVADIAADPLWHDYREIALAHGLRACWATPIYSATNKVLGSFAIYYPEPRAPAHGELRFTERASHLAGIVIARHQSEVALRVSEARARAIVESSPVGILMTAPDGKVLYANPSIHEQLGLPMDVAMGARWVEAIHSDDRQRLWEAWQQYLAGPQRYDQMAYEFVHTAKTARVLHVRAAPIRDGARLLGYVATTTDITERKLAEEQLRASAESLRDLSRRLIEVEESERRNINRELHDRIGQGLSVLNINLSLIRRLLPREALAAAGPRLQDAQNLVEAIVRQVRDVMGDLRPPALDDYGLVAALQAYAEPFSERTGLPVRVNSDTTALALPMITETALFRIAQEALNNVAKHARAKTVDIALAANGDRVTLAIADDGVGFEPGCSAAAPNTWGLKTMRERAAAVGASLRIESTPGKGTRVAVAVMRDAA